jgi:uncharacterized protein GlcG (DUF336 family)
MRRQILAWILACAPMALPAGAEEDKSFVIYRSLTPEVALELAQATLRACREAGYQAAVAVVDRGGALQVLLRDRLAGPHTPESARRKAFTAVSFRVNTGELGDATQAGKEASGIRHHPEVLMMGGGMVVWSRGEVVGGVGVSGAPGGKADEACAQKGLEAIRDKLDLF